MAKKRREEADKVLKASQDISTKAYDDMDLWRPKRRHTEGICAACSTQLPVAFLTTQRGEDGKYYICETCRAEAELNGYPPFMEPI